MIIPWEALIALLIYIIGSTLGFVWWMATQTIKLEFALTALDVIKTSLSMAEATYAKKVEIAEKFAIMDRAIEKQWDEIDKLRDNNHK